MTDMVSCFIFSLMLQLHDLHTFLLDFWTESGAIVIVAFCQLLDLFELTLVFLCFIFLSLFVDPFATVSAPPDDKSLSVDVDDEDSGELIELVYSATFCLHSVSSNRQLLYFLFGVFSWDILSDNTAYSYWTAQAKILITTRTNGTTELMATGFLSEALACLTSIFTSTVDNLTCLMCTDSGVRRSKFNQASTFSHYRLAWYVTFRATYGWRDSLALIKTK